MANLEFYGMFDFLTGDTDTYKYTSEEFSSLIKGLAGTGISKNMLNEFACINNGLTVTVASGVCFIEGRYGYNSTPSTITLTATSGEQMRYDRIVLTLNVANRTISLDKIMGTASSGTPTKPTLTQTATVYQIPLYSCLVSNGSTITLEDERSFTFSAGSVIAELQSIQNELRGIPSTLNDMAGTLNISKGGTGATTKASALSSLGAAPSNHSHNANDINDGFLPIARGGTSATNVADARTNLGMGDVVSDIGASGNWKWRIWSSGMVELWYCHINYGTVELTKSGDYYYADRNISLPSSITLTNINSVIANVNSNGSYMIQPHDTSIANQYVQIRFYSWESYAKTVAGIYLYVTGTV